MAPLAATGAVPSAPHPKARSSRTIKVQASPAFSPPPASVFLTNIMRFSHHKKDVDKES